jgi:sugar (pentulose or hexulose) kinase
VAPVTEATCLGTALLAGRSMGVYQDQQEVLAPLFRGATTIEPDKKNVKFYEAMYQAYMELHHKLRECFATLADL